MTCLLRRRFGSALERCLVLGSHVRGELLRADAIGLSSGRSAAGDSSEPSSTSVLILRLCRRRFFGSYLPLVVEARGVMGRDVGVDRGPRFAGPTASILSFVAFII